jgi:L-histidine Nalpha-methyltransferase
MLTRAAADRTQDTSLAGEVRHFLSQAPRQLPSRALYDALGSALFDAICELPWYPLTRAERRLIATRRDEILRSARMPARLVELGPGNGAKLSLLLGEAERTDFVRCIDLVDVSATALADAARRLREIHPARVTTYQARYEEGLVTAHRAARTGERTLVLFLGSNIGNFDPEGARAFLCHVRASLSPEDTLLIGADLVKPEAQLLLAYDDPLGVTAAFNKNLLLHLNAALGANFDVGAFSHRAVWNADAARVEMHLVSRIAQEVAIPTAGLAFSLEQDESIWTESSYKYTPDGFKRLLASAGLAMRERWIDDEGQFLLALAAAH